MEERLVDLELARAQVGDRVDYILEGGPREGDITRSDLNDVVEIF